MLGKLSGTGLSKGRRESACVHLGLPGLLFCKEDKSLELLKPLLARGFYGLKSGAARQRCRESCPQLGRRRAAPSWRSGGSHRPRLTAVDAQVGSPGQVHRLPIPVLFARGWLSVSHCRGRAGGQAVSAILIFHFGSRHTFFVY